jgi:lysophospholipase L1-like esterase
VWATRYAGFKAVNLGIGGDRTQHVLWRLDHGNMEGLTPKVAVVMIGTNNTNGSDNTAAEIADGIKKIVAKVQEKSPATKVLLLAVFPRGEAGDPQRDKIAQINGIIKELDDGKRVRFLDIGRRFLEEDGSLPKNVMPDLLHLSASGYEIWGDAMGPLLVEMMGGK